MKQVVFISSVQSEFERERREIARYIREDALFNQYFEPFLFEELPAQDVSAKHAYLKQAAHAGIYLLLVGDRYGYEDAEGVSPTEREYNAATENHVYRLAFLKDCHSREPKEETFRAKIDAAVIRNTFCTWEDLKTDIYAALVYYLKSHGMIQAGPFDARIHPEATIADLDKNKIRWFVGMAREKRQYPISYTEENIPLILSSLNLITTDQHLTNAALLLFAKDTQHWFTSSHIKCAQFYGTKVQKPMLSQQIYTGTVFDLVDQAFSFVMSRIDHHVGDHAQGAADIKAEIPPMAVFEAIVNAVVHRDYTDNGSVQVMLFQDRLEVWSPGRMPAALTLAQLRTIHRSIPVNPLLADVVYMSGYVEQLGTGTLDMINLCEEQGLPAPVFAEDFEFRSVIYRPEKQQADVLESADRDKVRDKARDKAGDKVRDKVTGQVIGQVPTQIQRIVFAIRGDNLTREEIMLRMGLSASRSFRENYLYPAINAGYIEKTYVDTNPKQTYYLTIEGLQLLKELSKRKQ